MKSALMEGQRFGNLIVLRKSKLAGRTWDCICDCCKQTTVDSRNLRSGHTKSCGCARRQTLLTHGLYKSSEYSVWRSLLPRCRNPKSPAYKYYGGRGINVPDEWVSGDGSRSGFEVFLADVGQRPSLAHTLDRRDNSKGYSRGNCRWATRKQQMNNMRRNRLLTHDGSTLTVAQWTKLKGLTENLIAGRLRMGWSVARAIDTPPGKNLRRTAKAQMEIGLSGEQLLNEYKARV